MDAACGHGFRLTRVPGAFLLVLGLVGGWILAGRMLAPLTQITDAARRAGSGSLSHRIRMKGRQDEFRELSDTFDSMLEAAETLPPLAEQRRITFDVTGGAARTSGPPRSSW